MSYPLIVALIVTASAFLLWNRRRLPSSPLPPGPKPWPIIGNMLDMPKARPWLTFENWTRQYGDIVSVNVMGKTTIILGSDQVVHDLFEQSTYSDRPFLVMLDLMEFSNTLGTIPLCDNWRKQRRVLHHGFGPTVTKRYQPIQRRESRRLLHRLLMEPDNYIAHLRLCTGAITMQTLFGLKVTEWNDRHIQEAERVVEAFSDFAVPGVWLVEQIPILRHIPEWFPLAEFKKKTAQARKHVQYMMDVPMNIVKDEVSQGKSSVSAMSIGLEKAQAADDPEDEEEMVKGAMLSAYSAAMDTTYGILQTFLLAMAMYPEVQKKAQMELDRVMGQERLPQFEDKLNLPYIDAIVKEVLRWLPVVPLGILHSASGEGSYRGYYIPRGSILIANLWALLRNPNTYPEPEKFIPERFLADGTVGRPNADPDIVFGTGRRTCPGRWLAYASVFSVISHILAVFNIEPPLDSDGHPMKLEANLSPQFITHPEPFEVRFILRPMTSRALLEHIQEETGD